MESALILSLVNNRFTTGKGFCKTSCSKGRFLSKKRERKKTALQGNQLRKERLRESVSLLFLSFLHKVFIIDKVFTMAEERNQEQEVATYKEQIRLVKEEYKEEKKRLKRQRRLFLDDLKRELSNLKRKERENLSKEEKQRIKLRKEELQLRRRKELLLPVYSRGEELMNAISHIVGGAFALIATIVGIVYASPDPLSILSMAIYGFGMIAVYVISSVYHFLGVNKAKKVFQVIDHCTIYVLICGTYVPVCVLMLSQVFSPWAYLVLGIVAALSILGIVLNATMMKRKAVKVISIFLYVAIGWLIVFFFPWLQKAVSFPTLMLFLFGGISYTIGAILYGIGHVRKYFHFIFHLFCLLGTILQFVGVLLFLL